MLRHEFDDALLQIFLKPNLFIFCILRMIKEWQKSCSENINGLKWHQIVIVGSIQVKAFDMQDRIKISKGLYVLSLSKMAFSKCLVRFQNPYKNLTLTRTNIKRVQANVIQALKNNAFHGLVHPNYIIFELFSVLVVCTIKTINQKIMVCQP